MIHQYMYENAMIDSFKHLRIQITFIQIDLGFSWLSGLFFVMEVFIIYQNLSYWDPFWMYSHIGSTSAEKK